MVMHALPVTAVAAGRAAGYNSGVMSNTTNDKVTINRTLVGVLALICLLSAVAIWLTRQDAANADTNATMWQAAFTRVGLVMAAFWIALPSKGREAAWANISKQSLVVILLGLVALTRLKLQIVLPAVAVLLVLGSILRPRPKNRPAARSHRRSARPRRSPAEAGPRDQAGSATGSAPQQGDRRST